MNKKEIERNIIVLLFALVLVVFSFAERASKNLEKMYPAAQLSKQGSQVLSDVAVEFSVPVNSNQ
jgi:hypothetical protein